MNTHKYLIEKIHDISPHDLLIFRSFYGPILGPDAISIYQHLCDMGSYNFSWNSILMLIKLLKLNLSSFDSSRKLLESLGLITTYENIANSTYIFSINRPLSIDEFISNKLLFNLLKKNIGDLHAERLILNFRNNSYDKSEFENISSKYHDNFSVENVNEFSIKNTMDIELVDFDNIEEAIEKLSVFQFVKYLTQSRPSITQTISLNNFLSSGLSDASINLILEYSFNVNGKIVYQHVAKIVHSFSHGTVKSFYDIKKKLQSSLNNKKFNITKPNSYNNSSNVELDESSIDEIFNKLQSLS